MTKANNGGFADMQPVPPPKVELPEADQVTDWRAVALFLWDRLDDIDTMDDMAKGNDQAYRARVQRLQRRRFEVGITDGHEVRFFDPTP